MSESTELVREGMEKLEELCSVLGTTVEQFYPILIHEAQVRGIFYTALGGFFVLLFSIIASNSLFRLLRHKSNGTLFRENKSEAWVAGHTMITIIALFLVLLSSVTLIGRGWESLCTPNTVVLSKMAGLFN